MRNHWDEVYGRRAANELSWFEGRPSRSLEMIAATGVDPAAALIDVGGGASTLVDELLAKAFSDVTVLDVSKEVLAKVSVRLGERHPHVALIQQDITSFRPSRHYALWHDRAVFHFLTSAADRQRYREALLGAAIPGSHVIIATFGPEGPTRCSGLDTLRYDARALAEELGTDFELVKSVIDTHATPSGAQQQFLYTHFVRRE
jgi:hypothetical protein